MIQFLSGNKETTCPCGFLQENHKKLQYKGVQHFIPNIRDTRKTPVATIWSMIFWVKPLFFIHISRVHRWMPISSKRRHVGDVKKVHRKTHSSQNFLQHYVLGWYPWFMLERIYRIPLVVAFQSIFSVSKKFIFFFS